MYESNADKKLSYMVFNFGSIMNVGVYKMKALCQVFNVRL